MTTRVYITVDTENSMGDAWDRPDLRPVPSDRIIFCRRQGRDFGIGWMCGLLNERKLRATFFCETLAALVLGEDDTRAYIEFLLEQGQDVQLHAHPNYLHYAEYLRGGPAVIQDSLARLPLDQQRRVLTTASELFERFTGHRPFVYRAGNFEGSLASLAVLHELGFLIDSSYNPAFLTSFDDDDLLLNVPQFLNGLWELPFTVAHERFAESSAPRHLKYFDPAAMSCWEMRQVLEQAHRSQLTDVVIMLHSFSGVKPRDEQYSSFRPDHIVRRRFAWLLDYLAVNTGRFRVTTMGEVAPHLPFTTPAAPPPLPELGWTRPFLRKVVQGVNRIL